MRIPLKIKASASKIIANTFYLDVCKISRSERIRGEYGDDSYVLKEIYNNVPCKCSNVSSNNTVPNVGEMDTTINYDFKLNLSLDYEIKLDDFIEITFANGGKGFFIAGKPYRYPTHQVIKIVAKERG